MNAITYAINNIKYNIDKDILKLAFMEQNDKIKNISLDDCILNKVIRSRVLVDIDIIGGETTKFDLRDCVIKRVSEKEYTLYVPKSVSNNRTIISALSIVPYQINMSHGESFNNEGFYQMESNPALTVGTKMMNALTPMNIMSITKLELISENTILANGYLPYPPKGVMKCTVTNDKNLNNFNPKIYTFFSKLCIYAVKAYIYTNMTVKLDRGYVYGGHELSVIKDIIDSYSDANELYSEYLTDVFQAATFSNDRTKMNNHIKNTIGHLV